MQELPLFLLVGVIGGVLGALFNKCWSEKMKSLPCSKRTKLSLILGVSILSSVLMYTLPAILPSVVCQYTDKLHSDDDFVSEEV